MTSAPATLPGTPVSPSSPESPRRVASFTSLGRLAPPPTVTDPSAPQATSDSRLRRTTTALTPASRTRRLLPPPRRRTGRSHSRAARRVSAAWSGDSGSTSQRAGPPMRKVVPEASGSRSRTGTERSRRNASKAETAGTRLPSLSNRRPPAVSRSITYDRARATPKEVLSLKLRSSNDPSRRGVRDLSKDEIELRRMVLKVSQVVEHHLGERAGNRAE